LDTDTSNISKLHKTNSEIKGSLNDRSFATLLCDLHYSNSTGYLHLESDFNLKIYFLHGFVQFVESENPDLLLGKLLVMNDMLSEEDQRKVIDFSKEKGIRIGEALIQLGKLSSHELSYILDLQMKLKLLNGFRFREGNYRFIYADSIDAETYFHINPIQIIYDAIDSYIYVEDINLKELEIEGTVFPTKHYDKISELKFSSARHYKLADMMKNPNTLDILASKSPLDKRHTLEFLQFLLIAQFVTIEEDLESNE